MRRTNARIVIASITQAGSNIPGRPGNLLINQMGEAKPENWFSNREFRNACLAQKFHIDIPLVFFKGSTLRFERIEIEPADVENGKVVEITMPGKDNMGNPRKATFKQPGLHNLNLTLDVDTMPVDRLMIISELSMKFEKPRAVTLAPIATGQQTEKLIDSNIEAPTEEKLETKPEEKLETKPEVQLETKPEVQLEHTDLTEK